VHAHSYFSSIGPDSRRSAGRSCAIIPNRFDPPSNPTKTGGRKIQPFEKAVSM
jgi:hypothetical protein